MTIIILVELMSLFYCFQVGRFERLCPVQLLVHNNLKTSETEGASSSKTTGKSSKEDRNFCIKGKNPWENTNLGNTQEMKDTFFPVNYFKSSTKLLKKFLFIKILFISKMILRLKNAEGMIIQIS